MSIPVIVPNHADLGPQNDFGVVEMRHGMKFAFPDDDIKSTDGSAIVQEDAGEMVSVNVEDIITRDDESVRLYSRLVKRGISRGDVPAVREVMGDVFPDVPDTLFSELPSQNGMDLVQEGFFKVVYDKFVKGMEMLWKMIETIWTFLYTKIRAAARKLYSNTFESRKYIATVDDILVDIKAQLGADWPTFEGEVEKVMSMEDVGKLLETRELMLLGNLKAHERVLANAEILAGVLNQRILRINELRKEFLALVNDTVARPTNGNVNDLRLSKLTEVVKELHGLWYLDTLPMFADLLKLDPRANISSNAAALETWLSQWQTEKPEPVRKGPNWHKDLSKGAELVSKIQTTLDVELLESNLATAERMMAGNSKLSMTGWEDGTKFDAFRDIAKTAMGLVSAWSRILSVCARYALDVNLLVAAAQQQVAQFRKYELNKWLFVLESDKRWVPLFQLTQERYAKELKKLGLYNIFTKKQDIFTTDVNGNLAKGKDFDQAMSFLSFEDEVSGAAYVSELTPLPVNLVERKREAQRDLLEVNEAIYRAQHRGSVSSPDEVLYRELRARYAPYEPAQVTMEGFGILKLAVIGAIAAAAYEAIRRLVVWILDLLKKRRARSNDAERNAQEAVKQKAKNDSVRTPSEKMTKDLDETKPNAAMYEAAGVKVASGEEQPPLSAADKLSAVNKVLDGARDVLLKTPAFDNLQRAMDTISLGYLREGALDAILMEIRRQRPTRISYLNDQCRELEAALAEQQRQGQQGVAPRLDRLFETLEQGKRAYKQLYDTTLKFSCNGLSAPGYLPTREFSTFGAKVFESATPIYPDVATIQQLNDALDGKSYAVFSLSGDELSNLAQTKFKELEVQFKKLRDVAQQVKALPQDKADMLDTWLSYINDQILEITAWYSFEETLHDRVARLVKAYHDYVFAEGKYISDELRRLGLAGWNDGK